MQSSIQCYLVLVGLILTVVHSAPNEDEITSLPGLPKPPTFKQYSGYLDAIGGRKLHYWFVESELKPANAPLVLWMNGGPGCSSVYGLLTENGPFRVTFSGKKLFPNPFSWNKVANVLYLEAPAGVGFSYIPGSTNYTTDDNLTALNNYQALLSFFQKFPEYQGNDFYITGESYGGIYVPTLSVLVVNNTNNFNFKGFAVGNGLHSWQLNGNSAVVFARNHALFSEELMIQLLKHCCNFSTPICDFYKSSDPQCARIVLQIELAISSSKINVYGIYKKCEKSEDGVNYLAEQFQPLKMFLREHWGNDTELMENLGLDPPCVDSGPVRRWINQKQVRQALHIPENIQNWEACSRPVGAEYTHTYQTMNWHYNYLLKNNTLRALIYHGDTDYMCSYPGGEWFVTALGRKLVKEYGPWSYKNQTAGFYKEFSNITYATVLGAGHMVPTDRPGQTLKLFSNFIYNKPMD